MVGNDLYFLTVDGDNARRAIGHLDPSKVRSTIPIGDETLDLEHLLVEAGEARLLSPIRRIVDHYGSGDDLTAHPLSLDE